MLGDGEDVESRWREFTARRIAKPSAIRMQKASRGLQIELSRLLFEVRRERIVL